MLVCIDKVTSARMYQRVMPLWRAKAAALRTAAAANRTKAAAGADEAGRAALFEEARRLELQADWLDEGIVGIIVGEAQNEVADFKKWGFDIVPHRALMKRGFETSDGKQADVDDAFKDPEHPFRVAIVCAMWLTGFDVECLSTLYIDKPMKAHTLMQAIARANRVYPGKDFGLIVDYNGMLKSLRAALAQYALGDDGTDGEEEVVAPIEERVQALVEAIAATEAHLRNLGFDPAALAGAKGFARIKAIADAVNAVYSSDEVKRRFEILARQMEGLDGTTRERVKQASRELLASIKTRLAELDRFWEKEQTKADVEVFILDEVFAHLPTPPFTPEEKEVLAANVYAHVWQQAINGELARAAT